jgi:hypothetical protein
MKKAGLLAYASLLPLPSHPSADSGFPRVAPHLQWRDRAGLTPAFPIKQITHEETAMPPVQGQRSFSGNPHLFPKLIKF